MGPGGWINDMMLRGWTLGQQAGLVGDRQCAARTNEYVSSLSLRWDLIRSYMKFKDNVPHSQ